ncbi:MAG: hypothetical protein P0S95_00645 [Rhabdochlamydiaceae bacterium]|nr:hypothetical protein [Candidatus Amphrikana amoebophyrae]
MFRDLATFATVWLFANLISFLPYSLLHKLGNGIGKLLYHMVPKFRKRTLSNLSLAKSLNLSELQKATVAKESFSNLVINCLEYAKLKRDRKLHKRLICENPELAARLIKSGQGVIFFCAHQANFEALFLEGTSRMPGVAVGNQFKNRYLTQWITSIRERFGGKILTQDEVIKEGMRALKKGKFLGLVGDQSLPSGGYYAPFLGTGAWTSPAPAMLSYKMKCPLIFASIRREKGKYYIHYSEPVWPNREKPMKEEINRLMQSMIEPLEKSIAQNPGQWMWQHNKWKQETPENVYYQFRHETILIILPKGNKFDSLLPMFEKIYPNAFLTLQLPTAKKLPFSGETIYYENQSDLFQTDTQTKLVFNFSGNDQLKRHYLKQTAFEVVDLADLERIAYEKQFVKCDDIRETLVRAICRPEYFPKSEVIKCPT